MSEKILESHKEGRGEEERSLIEVEEQRPKDEGEGDETNGKEENTVEVKEQSARDEEEVNETKGHNSKRVEVKEQRSKDEEEVDETKGKKTNTIEVQDQRPKEEEEVVETKGKKANTAEVKEQRPKEEEEVDETKGKKANTEEVNEQSLRDEEEEDGAKGKNSKTVEANTALSVRCSVEARKLCRVNFHVLVHEDFGTMKNINMCLKIETKEGIRTKALKVNSKDSFRANYIICDLEAQIQTSDIWNINERSVLAYNYADDMRNSLDSIQEELWMDADDNKRRYLYLDEEFYHGDVIHVYDGVVYPSSPHGMLHSFFVHVGILKSTEERIFLASNALCSAFLPTLHSAFINNLRAKKRVGPNDRGMRGISNRIELSAGSVFEKALYVADSLKRHFFERSSVRDVFRQMHVRLQEHIKPVFHFLSHPGECTEQVSRRNRPGLHIALGAVVLALIEKFDVPVDSDWPRLLLECVCIKQDHCEHITYDEIERLKSGLGDSKTAAARHILHFAKLIGSREPNKMNENEQFDCAWLNVIPTVHFLFDCCECSVYPKIDYNSESWWGLVQLQRQEVIFEVAKLNIDNFTERNRKDLLPLYDIDHLLPRTIAYLLLERKGQNAINNLILQDHFPLEVALACLLLFHSVNDDPENRKALQDMLRCVVENSFPRFLHIVRESLSSKQVPDNLTYRKLQIYEMAAALKAKVLDKKDKAWDLFTCCDVIRVHVIAAELKDDSRMFHDDALQLLVDTAGKFDQDAAILVGDAFLKDPKLGILICKRFLDVTFINLQRYKAWCDERLLQVEIFIRKVGDSTLFELLSEDAFTEPLPASLSDTIEKVAFDRIDSNPDVVASIDMNFSEAMGELLSKIIRMKVDCISESSDPFEELMRTTMLIRPVQLFQQSQFQEMNSLNEEGKEAVKRVSEILNEKKAQLFCGDITVAGIQTLKLHVRTFGNFLEGTNDARVLVQMLESRELEIAQYRRDRLISMEILECLHLTKEKFRTEEIQTQIDLALNLKDEFKIKDICDPLTPKDLKKGKQASIKPNPMRVQFPKDLHDRLTDIRNCTKSSVFMKMWDENLTAVFEERKGRKMALTSIEKTLWIPVYEKWCNWCTEMANGTVTLGDIRKYIGDITGNDTQNLSSELKTLSWNSQDTTWIATRLRQISQLDTIKSLGILVGKCRELRKVLKIRTEFSKMADIQKVIRDKEGTLPVNKLQEEELGMLEDIRKMNRKDCLEAISAFCKCQDFVTWVRENIDAEDQLEIVLDLIQTATSDDGDLYIHRTVTLEDVLRGYSDLLFLPLDIKESDFIAILLRFSKNQSQTLTSLIEKIEDISEHLAWLNDVLLSPGTGEEKSLSQAECIVRRGMITLGKHKDIKEHTSVTQADVIYVTGARATTQDKTEERSPVMTFTLEMLMDIQSRLMLIGGRDEDVSQKIDLYLMILDYVHRMSMVFVSLLNSGCVLFEQMQMIFRTSSETTFSLKFRYKEEESVITHCIKSDPKSINTLLKKCSRFLENIKDNWSKFLTKQRDDNYFLNIYTVNQLVFLQKEIVKLDLSQCSLDRKVFPLLSLVSSACTEGKLREVVGRRQRENKLQEQVFKLFAKKRAELEDQEGTGYRKDAVFEAFESLFEYFCEDILHHSSDFISMKDLGEILKSLAQKCKSEEERERYGPTRLSESSTHGHGNQQFSAPYRPVSNTKEPTVERLFRKKYGVEGEPNLFICPSGELLHMALAVYLMQRENQNATTGQPLPKPDEVLICTEGTTIDEIDAFFRRAVFKPPADIRWRKIYSLLFVDQLPHKTSIEATHSLKKVLESKERRHDFQLVVFCSSENESKSTLASELEKYRRPPFPETSSILKKVLKPHFVYDKVATGGIEPAALADPESLKVRVVSSEYAGNGKTLHKKRIMEAVRKLKGDEQIQREICIPLRGRTVEYEKVMEVLLKNIHRPEQSAPRVIHIDITPEAVYGVDVFLFKFCILGFLSNDMGWIWRRSANDHCLIEYTKPDGVQLHSMLLILPEIKCLSPKECSEQPPLPDGLQSEDTHGQALDFDDEEWKSEYFQIPAIYLLLHESKGSRIPTKWKRIPKDKCINVLLRYCGIKHPTWSEVKHFALFLTTQLQSFEHSVFCSLHTRADLPGFREFVIEFLIEMSRDFASRSAVISEETPMMRDRIDRDDINDFVPRKKWEDSPHPYLFFNEDSVTMTFVGFRIDRNTGNMYDTKGNILRENMMSNRLYDALELNGAPLKEDFDSLSREEKLSKICSVMGIDYNFEVDPDRSYKLTVDNSMKMLAIYMRFRSGIPVIIMGETGCGKTRLIKFLCDLQRQKNDVQNIILMKIHGGTSAKEIEEMVVEADNLAEKNVRKHGDKMYTVLFFDEANTSEAITLIKEVMCHRCLPGTSMELSQHLKIVAAVNPYRKHSDEMIEKLEEAGLGYHVRAERTTDRLGRIPMRHLVYRVVPLPQSMLPFVFDFGSLSIESETEYINQMTALKDLEKTELMKEDSPTMITLHQFARSDLRRQVAVILSEAQSFMRQQTDESSFVSLRNVERALLVMKWFQRQAALLRRIKKEKDMKLSDLCLALILTLEVCYCSSLRHKDEFLLHIAKFFMTDEKGKLYIPGDEQQKLQAMKEQIAACQHILLNDVSLPQTIAKNEALRENFMMMVCCIEMKIPLFIVGKPGSSKSLAKAIVKEAMQGKKTSSEKIFHHFREIVVESFQCSPLATPDGIVSSFMRALKKQNAKNRDDYVAVVVLDEVGLAEDSPQMPLKVLHHLLETGGTDLLSTGTEKERTGFIGISNWALDPAKVNRGILVQRDAPDDDELTDSARGICSSDQTVLSNIEPLLPFITTAYRHLFEICKEKKERREFFGLRDFYSLMKMLYHFAARSRRQPTWKELEHAVKRNFGGLENVDPMVCFDDMKDKQILKDSDSVGSYVLDNSPLGLVKAALKTRGEGDMEARYLLFLTENYALLPIIEKNVLDTGDDKERVVTIFGSSFRKDQEYTQVCKNINRIKICMEKGQTVILLNLENLYESLYDVLNQYYVQTKNKRYVDLGLGAHRKLCTVESSFRIIVFAEKEVVYKKLPIPLINRLEKHLIRVERMLTPQQQDLSGEIQQWITTYTGSSHTAVKKGDVFIGYHEDLSAAIVTELWSDHKNQDKTELLNKAKDLLLASATPDSVFRFSEQWEKESREIRKKYFQLQCHDSVLDFIKTLQRDEHFKQFVQVTTYSKLLSEEDILKIKEEAKYQESHCLLMHLQSFDTEHQFCQALRQFINPRSNSQRPTTARSRGHKRLLVVQCATGQEHINLIASARYRIQDEVSISSRNVVVILIVQLQHIAGGSFGGFQTGNWMSVHMDDVKKTSNLFPTALQLSDVTLGRALRSSLDEEESDRRIFDLDDLLYRCLHAAVCQLIDPVTNIRAWDRIKILLDLMEDKSEDAKHFRKVLCSCIAKLQLEKEESHILRSIVLQAAQIDQVRSAGTYRRSIEQAVEMRIAPLLAFSISIIDRNGNLDLIAKNRSLWNFLFESCVSTDILYQNMIDSRRNEVRTINVTSTGVNGLWFQPRFPFSWILYRQIEEIIMKVEGVDEEKQSQIVTGISGAMKKLQENTNNPEARECLFQEYLSDFFHMKFACWSELEYEALQKLLKERVKRHIRDWEDETSLPQVFLAVHKKFKDMHRELGNITLLIRTAPENIRIEILNDISASAEQNMKFDLFTLEKIIRIIEKNYGEKVEQNRLQSNDPTKGPSNWLRNVGRYFQIVQKILQDYNKEAGSKDNLNDLRLQWNKIRLRYMFIKQVFGHTHLPFRSLTNFTKLRQLLQNLDDLSSSSLIQHLWKYLTDISSQASQQQRIETQEFISLSCSFLLNVVSLFSVRPGEPIKTETVETLMQMVTDTTKGKGVTFSFREALLKLLLKTRYNDVNEFLNKYLENDLPPLTSCKMIVLCFENIARLDLIDKDTSNVKMDDLNKVLVGAIDDLKSNKCQQVQLFQAMAILRIAIDETSNILCLPNAEDYNELLEKTGSLVGDSRFAFLRYVIFNSIYRKRGLGAVQTVLGTVRNRKPLKWLDIGVKTIPECQDRLLFLGEKYISCRTQIQSFLKTSSTKEDDESFVTKIADIFRNSLHDRRQQQIIFLMAIHREITFTYLYEEREGRIAQQLVSVLQANLQSKDLFPFEKCQNLACCLVSNDLDDYLKMTVKDNANNQGIRVFLVHFLCVLTAESDKAILAPFHTLATDPAKMEKSFLPTMPEEPDMEEILQVMRQGGEDYNARAYRCPNNHLYVIGNCGNAVHVRHAVCQVCKEPIGGIDFHKLDPTNKKENNNSGKKDRRDRGHVIGSAEKQEMDPGPMREMIPAACAITRLFLHISLLLGSRVNTSSVSKIVKAIKESVSVRTFFYEHILKDLSIIQRVLQRNQDDTLLLLHYILKQIWSERHHNDKDRPEDMYLKTREGRKRWEKDFSTTYLEPVLQRHSRELENLKRQLSEKNIEGKDGSLIALLQELNRPISVDQTLVDRSNIHFMKPMWEIEEQITLHGFKNAFRRREDKTSFRVTECFLDQIQLLELLSYLPRLVKLQRQLLSRCNKEMEYIDAETMTITNFIESLTDADKGELYDLLEDYKTVWDIAKDFLPNHRFTIRVKKYTLGIFCPKDLCDSSINEDITKLSMLLPYHFGSGLTSYGLIHLLLTVHNEMLLKLRREKLLEVDLHDVNVAHTVNVSDERDILAIVLSNSSYVEEDNKTSILYDFQGFDEQLVETYLEGKPSIKMDGLMKVQYKSDITDFITFLKLDEKIRQVNLTEGSQLKIANELTSIPDCCSLLDTLNIAIDFLRSIGGEKDMSLHDFITQTLRMRHSHLGNQGQLICKLEHSKSLWLLTSMERTKLKINSMQESFETIPKNYKEKLDGVNSNSARTFINGLSKKKQTVLLRATYEFIVLRMISEDYSQEQDRASYDTVPLRDVLMEYVDGYDGLEDDDLFAMPEEIQGKHSVEFWKFTYTMSTE